MRIGVIEIMPIGHYTLVDSIIRIFTSTAENNVYLFANSNGQAALRDLLQENKSEVTSIVRSDGEAISVFLSKVQSYKLTRVYIVTPEKYLAEICHTNFGAPLYTFIHNIDEWFNSSFKYRLYHLVHEFIFSTKYLYVIKRVFIFPYWRKKILSKTFSSGGKIVVLNSILKNEAAKFIESHKIEVIPFSVFDCSLNDLSIKNNKLRICIPGVVSSIRRDYHSVFSIIENNADYFKDRIELDLLGTISAAENGCKIVEEAEKLISRGMTIHLYKSAYIPLKDYDDLLAKSDIILGNMNIQIDAYSAYGKTKDTGIPYTMIKAAKPGMIKSGFTMFNELLSSTMFFADYSDLEGLFKKLIDQPRIVESLKKEALINSRHFDPSVIYKQLLAS
jgi:hypothetical protein